jgi:hypothetical protein
VNRRIVLSVAAGGVLALAVAIGAGAVALAVSPIVPDDSAPLAAAAPTSSAAASPPSPGDPTTEETGPFARALRPGEAPITASRLRAEVPAGMPVDLDDPHGWLAEAVIEVRCMADKGYYYDPFDHGPESDPSDPSLLAFYGHTGAVDAYRWQDAGCHGLSVHETGNDENH